MFAHQASIVRANRIPIQVAILFLGFMQGCATGARVNLSAADALEGLSTELTRSLAEYHADLGRYDDNRERAALFAFIERVQANNGDPAQNSASAEDLLAALQKVRADRDAEMRRYMNSRENAAALAEVSSGLRQFAIQTSSLDDEAKRYFHDFIKKTTTKNTSKPALPERNAASQAAGKRQDVSSVASDSKP